MVLYKGILEKILCDYSNKQFCLSALFIARQTADTVKDLSVYYNCNNKKDFYVNDLQSVFKYLLGFKLPRTTTNFIDTLFNFFKDINSGNILFSDLNSLTNKHTKFLENYLEHINAKTPVLASNMLSYKKAHKTLLDIASNYSTRELVFVSENKLLPSNFLEIEQVLVFLFALAKNSDTDLFYVFRDLLFFKYHTITSVVLKNIFKKWSNKGFRYYKKVDKVLECLKIVANLDSIIEKGPKTHLLFWSKLDKQINSWYAMVALGYGKVAWLNDYFISNHKITKKTSKHKKHINTQEDNLDILKNIVAKMDTIKNAGLSSKLPLWYVELSRFINLDTYFAIPTLNLSDLLTTFVDINYIYGWNTPRQNAVYSLFGPIKELFGHS